MLRLGIILWELITCQTAFSGTFPEYAKTSDLKKVVVNDGKRPDLELLQNKLEFLQNKGAALKSISELLKVMWNSDPNVRPDIKTVLDRLRTIVLSLIEDKDAQEAWSDFTSSSDYIFVYSFFF